MNSTPVKWKIIKVSSQNSEEIEGSFDFQIEIKHLTTNVIKKGKFFNHGFIPKVNEELSSNDYLVVNCQ